MTKLVIDCDKHKGRRVWKIDLQKGANQQPARGGPKQLTPQGAAGNISGWSLGWNDGGQHYEFDIRTHAPRQRP